MKVWSLVFTGTTEVGRFPTVRDPPSNATTISGWPATGLGTVICPGWVITSAPSKPERGSKPGLAARRRGERELRLLAAARVSRRDRDVDPGEHRAVDEVDPAARRVGPVPHDRLRACHQHLEACLVGDDLHWLVRDVACPNDRELEPSAHRELLRRASPMKKRRSRL